mgnify:CR=1 FL=1
MYDFHTQSKHGGARKRTIEELILDEEFMKLAYSVGDATTELSPDSYVFEDSITCDRQVRYQTKTPSIRDQLAAQAEELEGKISELSRQLSAKQEYYSECKERIATTKKDIKRLAKEAERNIKYTKEGRRWERLNIKKIKISLQLKEVERRMNTSIRDYKISVTNENIKLLERTGIFKDLPGLREYIESQPYGKEVVIRRITMQEEEFNKLKKIIKAIPQPKPTRKIKNKTFIKPESSEPHLIPPKAPTFFRCLPNDFPLDKPLELLGCVLSWSFILSLL